MKKTIYIILGLLMFSFYACQEDVDVEVGKTATLKMAGQWWLHEYDDAMVEQDNWLEAYTFNTSENTTDSIWLELHDYDLRVKVAISLSAETFTATQTEDVVSGGAYDIADGKIIRNATTTMGGHTVDSIYFTLNDGTDTYIYAGQRFTGFPEDDPFTPEQ